MHAEMSVCAGLPNSMLCGAVLYVIRIDRRGNICNSRPCKGCSKYLDRKKIGRVYYSV